MTCEAAPLLKISLYTARERCLFFTLITLKQSGWNKINVWYLSVHTMPKSPSSVQSGSCVCVLNVTVFLRSLAEDNWLEEVVTFSSSGVSKRV